MKTHPHVIPELIHHQRIRATTIHRGPDANTGAELFTLDDGTQLFAKSGKALPPDFFHAEARGLRWLAEPAALPVPEVIAAFDDMLLTRWVPPGDASPAGAETLGRGLAGLHRADVAKPTDPADAPVHFGAALPGYVGTLPLDNTTTQTWAEFFVTRRCQPYLRQARDAGVFDTEQAAELESLIGRIPELAGDPEPPSRIHGDLWSGNVHYDAAGRPWLIDGAAAHYGHRETDVATLLLFGAPFAETAIAAYNEVSPLQTGWRERMPMHQLHLLLVHAVTFGSSYAEAVLAAARTLRRAG